MAAAARTHPSLTNIVATYTKAGINALGYLVWFSVPDAPVEYKKLRLRWIMAQLDEKVVPEEPRPLYLFKRAMREQEGKVKHNGHVTETDVRQVVEDGDFCVYQISRVTRDRQKREVDYPKALRVVFNKDPLLINLPGDAPIDYQPLGETPKKDVQPMIDAIRAFYTTHGKMIDGRKVREMVRSYIRNSTQPESSPGKGDDTVGLSGENLRGKGGAVYFVPAEHKAALDGLAEALANVYEDGSAYLYAMPIPDVASTRKMVHDRRVENAKEELEEAYAEAGKLLRSDRKQAVRADHAAFHWRALRTAQKRAKEYQQLLHGKDDEIDQLLQLAEAQLNKLPQAVAA